ncbi:MAG: TIGR03013 family XrtA/PEP-CTERM system glycosyltransferase [bacterium]
MAHLRIFRHYIHTPFVFTALLEGVVLFFAAYLGHFTRFGLFPGFSEHFVFALTFAGVLLFFMVAMGVYEARLREGYVGVMLRTAVAVFLLGTIGMALVLFLFPDLVLGRGVLLFASIEGFLLVAVLRWLTSNFVDEDFMKSRVLILGTGQRAVKVASRMRRRSDRRAFVLDGFMQLAGTPNLIAEFGAHVIAYPESGLAAYCATHDIDQIVVAADDRRADGDSAGGIPFEELMDCRLSGVDVCEVQNFIEREACKIDVDLLQRSWLVYSDGFVTNWYRALIKRLFDIVVATLLFIGFLPIILISGLAILVCDKFRGPLFYRQQRVGKNGTLFTVVKFRTMQVDAEDNGAMWAEYNDPRTTRVGAFLRRSHLDELPQLLNVIRGDMSMVGPRPERPVFVNQLNSVIPYYEERHRMQPGITGWAQLCYPYGASIEDAKEKLQYDLYYVKNHSILLDMIILLQTVEVVLVGEGSR